MHPKPFKKVQGAEFMYLVLHKTLIHPFPTWWGLTAPFERLSQYLFFQRACICLPRSNRPVLSKALIRNTLPKDTVSKAETSFIIFMTASGYKLLPLFWLIPYSLGFHFKHALVCLGCLIYLSSIHLLIDKTNQMKISFNTFGWKLFSSYLEPRAFNHSALLLPTCLSAFWLLEGSFRFCSLTPSFLIMVPQDLGSRWADCLS